MLEIVRSSFLLRADLCGSLEDVQNEYPDEVGVLSLVKAPYQDIEQWIIFFPHLERDRRGD